MQNKIKNWQQSKTIMTNLIALAVILPDLALKLINWLAQNFDTVSPFLNGYLSTGTIAFIASILPPLNMYLRSITYEPVQFKPLGFVGRKKPTEKQMKEKITALQRSVGAYPHGAWGGDSQFQLEQSGNQIGINWDKFRSHFGRFNQSQMDGIDSILDAINAFGGKATNPLYVAYMLATAWHETARTMQPIEEYGKGRGRKYGKHYDVDGSQYKGLPHIYYGRGYVQLTWLTNYVLMRDKLGVDFVNKPALALDPKHASDIMIVGMLEGIFTGKSLSRYIKSGTYQEYCNARRIINGRDKAKLIADYAVKFLDCLLVE